MRTPGVDTSTTVVVLPDVSGLGAVSDEVLLELQRESGAARRRVDAVVAAISGELARRSARELGQGGLAARTGARTPEKAVQQLTGVSLTEAKAFVTVGTAVSEESPWLAPVADAVHSGDLSVATAAGIARGLGSPTADVAADDLLDAAAGLVEFARDASPESTAVAARQARERLDVTRIADLEEHRRSKRSLTWAALPDGTTRMTAILDPESAAIITGAIDTITSPRRGGPRFVNPTDQDRASDLLTDPRTLPQLALDALVDIVHLATRASAHDVATLFGVQSPAVRIHVQAADLKTGTGFSSIEGQTTFLSTATAKRLACDTGWLPVLFDGATPIDVGHTQRLHTPRQRTAATSHWNGCPWGDCDRPPAMTEMHHIQAFNGSNTTLDNAIPLCRFHHMQLHNNHWHIHQRPHGLVAISPTGEEVPLHPKTPFAT
ncbi:DUF222 domain-containing protein [Schumannella luteola]